MSIIPEAEPLYEDVITVIGMTQRQVNTQYGTKPVFDILDNRDRKFSTFKEALATQVYNLALPNGQPNGAQIRVRYREKPSSDPSRFPPNLNIEAVEPAAGQPMLDGAQAAPQGFSPAPAAQQQPTPAQPVQAQSAAPAPVQAPSAASQIPAATGGTTEHDKQCMRRSAALKAAAYYHGALGGEMIAGDQSVDFWTFANQCLEYIESGTDPVPFRSSPHEGADEPMEQQ